ncbi:MAG: tRNA/rRNA methyltransferase (SpoU) [Rhodocyclaceae bacterium]|nr:tRNA/rRNA methyltransferase (SpoU) [Rhodocyclaceae bacterium]
MKHIQSRDNPFFKELKRLAQSGRERRKTGRTLLDGIHLITAYETAVGSVENLAVSESGLERAEICDFIAGREAVLLSDALFREVGVVDHPSGIMAVAEPPAGGKAPDGAADTVLLDGLQDPGNVGTLLRTAAAAGFRQVLLAPDCAAPWSPKVLRAGQGAHFVIDIFEDADLASFLKSYAGTAAVTCLEGAQSLFEARWEGPVAWVFGSEGLGVRPEVAAAAKLRIRIPMPGQVESLNVGAAAAVCLFETLRRRLA